ncbi:MAG: hypothetical protein N3A66_12255, partial [Planctomycetota bacterium]|nr:hypothetical protein [Planctomycetota bacterium]
DWQETCGSSCSHAWTAHPAYHLVNILAGIRQLAPAWRRIVWAPFFLADLDHVAARLPSPQGEIATDWERQGDKIAVSLALPAGVAALAHRPLPPLTLKGKRNYRFVIAAPDAHDA